ncbi:MAG: lysylphosphatidylglycerol synthase transmembrane domain-containing protein [bacterium]|nr:lysylphosphatidylglycerol synthase transmembrane domain-containing protein [bacterium]
MKNILKVLLRIGISGLLLFFILKRVNFKETFELLKNANMRIFLTSFAGYTLLAMSSALRWHRLLLVQDVKVAYRNALAYYLIGFFYNNFLPAVFGGSVIRALYAGRTTGKNKEAFSSVLTELLIGSWAVVSFTIIVIIISFVWFRPVIVKTVIIPILTVFVIASTLIYLFFERGFMRKFKGIVERVKVFELGNKVKEFYNAMYLYREEKKTIFEVILVSFIMQLSIAFMNLSVGISLGFKLPIMSYVVYPTIIGLLATIPITINGLGLREWGYRFFFAQMGLTESQAVTLSLLFYFVGVIGSLAGGIIFPFMKLKPQFHTNNRVSATDKLHDKSKIEDSFGSD